MIAVPPALLDVLALQPGAKVDVTVEAGRLVIAPRQRVRYRLDELLAQCDPGADPSDMDGEWLEAPPVGSELT